MFSQYCRAYLSVFTNMDAKIKGGRMFMFSKVSKKIVAATLAVAVTVSCASIADTKDASAAAKLSKKSLSLTYLSNVYIESNCQQAQKEEPSTTTE